MTTTTPSSTPSSPPEPSSSGDGAASARLDLTGEVCPYTFVRARLALEELPLGATLVIEGDHQPAKVNVPRSAAAWGQEVVAVTDLGDRRWRIVLRKRVE
jgi:TusA-related sulfurtransferase